jgi:pimeloyl-ACP methyl ester carboxylesterase
MAEIRSSADGVPVVYEVHGTGMPALVLVHGWSCDRSYWKDQVEPLSRRFRVVTVDLAGHGESGLGRARWTIAAFGADVATVVDALGLDRVVLIGHSMGGDAILEAARLLPGRIEGLVWIDVYRQLANFQPPERVEERMAPFRADFVGTTRTFVRDMFPPGADPALVERVVADMSAAPPEVALEAAESAWGYGRKVPAALQGLALPIIAINSEDRAADLESMARHGVEVVVMPGVGHFPMMEDPARFNEILIRVLERFDRGG